MKRMFLCSLFLLWPAVVFAQDVTVPAGRPVHMEWDYTADSVRNGVVTRFEVRLDTGAFSTVGVPAPVAVDQTYRYTFSPALMTIGVHVGAVRACNISNQCSADLSASFTISPIPPPAPGKPRIIGGDAPIGLDEAATMAHAYSTLVSGRPLRPEELAFLVANYSGAVTRYNVLTYLDTQFIRWIR
jgi:hypothetical protein